MLVNYFILFLISSNIMLSSGQICGPYESWGEVLYTDIWFSRFNHSHDGDCGPCLWCVNLLKLDKDRSAFLSIVGGNSKGVFLCIFKGNGLNAKLVIWDQKINLYNKNKRVQQIRYMLRKEWKISFLAWIW